MALLLLCAAVGFSLYAKVLNGSFQFDDYITIVNNPAVKDIDRLDLLWPAFNSRLLTGLTFAANYAVGGLSTTGYHLVNILIHALNAFLVYVFLRSVFAISAGREKKTGPGAAAAVFAALIFLAHPAQTQAVSYITQRASGLAAMFYLSTLVFYVKARREESRACLFTAWLLCAAAMFTKELAVTLPLMLLVLDFYFFSTQETAGQRIRRMAPFLATMVFVPLMIALDRQGSVLDIGSQVAGSQWNWTNILTQLNVLRTYLRIFLFPVGLNLDYDYPRSPGLNDGMTVLALVMAVLWMAVAFNTFKRRRLLSFFLMWYPLTIAVEFAACSLISRDLIFEHYLYLPMAGFAALFSVGMESVSKRRDAYLAAMTAVVVCLSVLTWQRNDVWRDPVGLWTDVIHKSPNKARGYSNLGLAYRWRGDLPQAIRYYQKALKIGGMEDAARSQILTNLGAAYGRQGNYFEEIRLCREALKFDPYNAQAYSNLGYAYFLQGDIGQAQEFGRKAVEIKPDFAEGYVNLGVIYAGQGRYQQAFECFQRAVRLDPDDPEARKNFEQVQEFLGRS